jgi:hypothetical protein
VSLRVPNSSLARPTALTPPLVVGRQRIHVGVRTAGFRLFSCRAHLSEEGFTRSTRARFVDGPLVAGEDLPC